MKYLLLGVALFVAATVSAQTRDSVTDKGHYVNTPHGPLKTGGYKPVRQPETIQETSTNKNNSTVVAKVEGTLNTSDSAKGVYHSTLKAANRKHKAHRCHRRHPRKPQLIRASSTTTLSGKKDI